MATAARRERWDHTACLASTILNSRQGVKRSQLVDAVRLHPLRETPKRVLRGAEARATMAAIFSG